jgi:type II secretory pathway component PulF
MQGVNQETYSRAEVASLIGHSFVGWVVVASLFCIYPSVMVFSRIDEFAAMYKGFGAELPSATQFLLENPVVLLVFPALVIGLVVYTYTRSTKAAIASHRWVVWSFALLCCGSMLLNAYVTNQLYEPIFRLGAVV